MSSVSQVGIIGYLDMIPSHSFLAFPAHSSVNISLPLHRAAGGGNRQQNSVREAQSTERPETGGV